MPTPPKKQDYTILRTDNSFLTYTLQVREYDKMCEAIMEGKNFFKTSIGLIRLDDIRHILEIPEIEEEKPNEPIAPNMTEEEYKWYQENVAPFYREDGE